MIGFWGIFGNFLVLKKSNVFDAVRIKNIIIDYVTHIDKYLLLVKQFDWVCL